MAGVDRRNGGAGEPDKVNPDGPEALEAGSVTQSPFQHNCSLDLFASVAALSMKALAVTVIPI